MPCQTMSKHIIKADNKEKKISYLYLLRCKQWDCPYCGHVNKLQWVAKISHGIDVYQDNDVAQWQFLTLTSHRKLQTRNACLWVGPKAWKKLSSRLRYSYPQIKYVKIPELHKNGRVHWHLMASGGVTTAWLKRNAPKCGYGYMAEAEPVRDGYNSVLYISKELSKQLGIKMWPKGLRRIATTQGWPELPNEEEFDETDLIWNYVGIYEEHEVNMLVRKTELLTGYEVKIIANKSEFGLPE